MKKQLLLCAVAIVAGLSACNDETLPTEGRGNLLENPSDAVVLQESEYGMAFEDFYTEALGDTIKALPPFTPADSLVPYYPLPPLPKDTTKPIPPGYVHESSHESGNYSNYKPSGTIHSSQDFDKSKYRYPGTRHISAGVDQSKYTPPGGEHIKEGKQHSMYKPTGTVHIEDEHNRSKYKPSGSEHIKDGANVTKYKPVGWVHFGGPPSIDNTKYLPPGYVHIAKGPDESKYYKPASTPAGQ